jgi:1-acyl-sn-glycerol-3-phosphate acyltransferase
MRQSLTWRFATTMLIPLLRIALKLRMEGRENIAQDHPQIIACNHTSHIDPLIAGYSAGLETAFLAKEEVFRASRFLGWLIRKYHSYPVNRGAGDVAALRKCSELLGQKRTLVLFPEGTRSKPGNLQPLRPGVAMLAIMNNVPIVPAFISGVRRSFVPWIVDPDIIRYQQRTQPGSFRFRLASLWDSSVRIFFGRPLCPDGFQRSKDDYRRLTEQLHHAMLELEQRFALVNAGNTIPHRIPFPGQQRET